VEVFMRRTSFSILVLLLVPAVFASAATIVAPNGYAAVEGNNAGSFPFTNFTGRYQQAYAAGEFGSGPLSISEIAFRTDASPATQTWLNQLAFSLRLSTGVLPVGSLSTTFADNVGGDDTLVYTAPALQLRDEDLARLRFPRTRTACRGENQLRIADRSQASASGGGS
jgi:hypothetical protein